MKKLLITLLLLSGSAFAQEDIHLMGCFDFSESTIAPIGDRIEIYGNGTPNPKGNYLKFAAVPYYHVDGYICFTTEDQKDIGRNEDNMPAFRLTDRNIAVNLKIFNISSDATSITGYLFPSTASDFSSWKIATSAGTDKAANLYAYMTNIKDYAITGTYPGDIPAASWYDYNPMSTKGTLKLRLQDRLAVFSNGKSTIRGTYKPAAVDPFPQGVFEFYGLEFDQETIVSVRIAMRHL